MEYILSVSPRLVFALMYLTHSISLRWRWLLRFGERVHLPHHPQHTDHSEPSGRSGLSGFGIVRLPRVRRPARPRLAEHQYRLAPARCYPGGEYDLRVTHRAAAVHLPPLQSRKRRRWRSRSGHRHRLLLHLWLHRHYSFPDSGFYDNRHQ